MRAIVIQMDIYHEKEVTKLHFFCLRGYATQVLTTTIVSKRALPAMESH